MVAKTPRGLVIVYTGDGKGKTTAALGLAMRAVGHGHGVAFVQFVKARRAGEHRSAERLAPELAVFRLGAGFVAGEPGPEHRDAARQAVEQVRTCLSSGRCRLVVADEVLTAVGLELLSRAQVERLLADRPDEVHLVLTGRGAWQELLDRADLVTEMRLVKHPYDRGVGPQAGIEY